jgi:hypothetical protein
MSDGLGEDPCDRPERARVEYAPWIPEVLDELAALADLPDPPSTFLIDRARQEVVTRSEEFPKPTVYVEEIKGKAIDVRYGNRGIVFTGIASQMIYGWV